MPRSRRGEHTDRGLGNRPRQVELQRRRPGRSRPDHLLARGVDAHLAWLQKELGRIEADLDDAVRASPAWRASEDLLASVPGIGKTSAYTLIRAARARHPGPAPDREPRRHRPAQPRQRHPPRPTHGDGGRASVRAALCMPTLTAIRKLLTVLNAILRDQTPWQPA